MAKDIYHDSVVIALEKEGWEITNDPYKLRFEGVTYDIDLGAEKVIAAEKDSEKIAVEIKTFQNLSLVTSFYEAIGKYMSYQIGLLNKDPERTLFLAIPLVAYRRFFRLPIIEQTINAYNIHLIVYHPHKKIIEAWIK